MDLWAALDRLPTIPNQVPNGYIELYKVFNAKKEEGDGRGGGGGF